MIYLRWMRIKAISNLRGSSLASKDCDASLQKGCKHILC